MEKTKYLAIILLLVAIFTIYVEQRTIPAVSHNVEKWEDAGNGRHIGKCTDCGETVSEKHIEFIDLAEEATCSEPGKTEGKHCSKCDAVTVEQKMIEKTEHILADGVNNEDGTHTATCTTCGTSVTQEHVEVIDNAVEPTSTEPGKTEGKHCSICNAVTVAQTTIEKTQPTPQDPTTEPTIEAEHSVAKWTDTGNGKHSGKCTGCGETVEEEHTEVTDEAEKATCTTAGKTAGKHCSECNAVTVAQTTVAATGHNVTIWADAENGKHEGTCTICGETIEEKHTEVTDEAKQATCITAGKTEGKHCSICNAITVEQTIISAKGHNIESLSDIGNGKHSGECTECGEIKTENHTYENGKCTECNYECLHTRSKDNKDETHHWKECEDCRQITEKESHNYDEEGKCNCGASIEVPSKPECEHENKESKKDHYEHWEECKDCGEEIENSRERHTYSEGECDICGMKDDTGSDNVLPDTGEKTIVIVATVFVSLTIIGAIMIKKYKEI